MRHVIQLTSRPANANANTMLQTCQHTHSQSVRLSSSVKLDYLAVPVHDSPEVSDIHDPFQSTKLTDLWLDSLTVGLPVVHGRAEVEKPTRRAYLGEH